MSVLVLWFRDGELYKAQACSQRTWRRTANQWNEYAKTWNRLRESKHLIATVPEGEIMALAKAHEDLPKHTPKDLLKTRRWRKLANSGRATDGLLEWIVQQSRQ